jgi:ankyrin repeat protein
MDYATPLQLAAQDGHLEMVKSLLAKGADVNLMGDNHSSTPLGLAAEFGRLSVAKELLDAGAEVNLASTEIDLPLYLAAYEGHETVVKLLLNAGARLWDDLLVVHQHGRNECNGCDVGIVGDRRFTCTACPDLDLDLEGVSDGRDSYDLCGACHANRIAEEANDAEEESRTHKHRFTEVFHSISLAAVICMRDNLLESA